MSTTYIFGSGASRDVGYPLASEMGDGLLELHGASRTDLIGFALWASF